MTQDKTNNDTVSRNEAPSARAAYQREWRKRNPYKNREYIQRYWARKDAALREARGDAVTDTRRDVNDMSNTEPVFQSESE